MIQRQDRFFAVHAWQLACGEEDLIHYEHGTNCIEKPTLTVSGMPLNPHILQCVNDRGEVLKVRQNIL